MQDLILIFIVISVLISSILVMLVWLRRPSARLEERLALIENAIRRSDLYQQEVAGQQKLWLENRLKALELTQQRLDALVPKITDLQDILGNKMRRGAYGEYLLETQLADTLPRGSYERQAKLSNGSIVDCLIKMPKPINAIAIDSKFPLEASRKLSAATDDQERKIALGQLVTDIGHHIKKIATSYIIAGETADWALLYIPSEAVYADIYAHAPVLLDNAYKQRVMIVSPATIMAVLGQLNMMLRDHEIQNQVQAIRTVIVALGQDATRLVARVQNLKQHFRQVGKDVDEITISGEKIGRKAESLGQAGEQKEGYVGFD